MFIRLSFAIEAVSNSFSVSSAFTQYKNVSSYDTVSPLNLIVVILFLSSTSCALSHHGQTICIFLISVLLSIAVAFNFIATFNIPSLNPYFVCTMK